MEKKGKRNVSKAATTKVTRTIRNDCCCIFTGWTPKPEQMFPSQFVSFSSSRDRLFCHALATTTGGEKTTHRDYVRLPFLLLIRGEFVNLRLVNSSSRSLLGGSLRGLLFAHTSLSNVVYREPGPCFFLFFFFSLSFLFFSFFFTKGERSTNLREKVKTLSHWTGRRIVSFFSCFIVLFSFSFASFEQT